MKAGACQSLASVCFIIITIAGGSPDCPSQQTGKDALKQGNPITVNPTFVAAKNDAQRCQALDSWYSSIRADAVQEIADGNAPNWWVLNGTLDWRLIENRDWLLQFATHSFQRNIGKRLPDLSTKERERLYELLVRCPDPNGLAKQISTILYYSDSADRWRTQFDQLEGSFATGQQQRKKVMELESAKQNVLNTGYQIGALLKEAESYSLHKSAYRSSSDWSVPFDWCNQYDNRAAMVGLLFKDENAAVDNSSAYWNRFETEMLPAITAQCPGINRVYVVNYVRGYQIHYRNLRIDRYVDSNTPSEALSSGIYLLGPTATPKYTWFYGVGSDALFNQVQLAGSGRGEIEVRGSGRDSRLADSSLTSIARLQTVFKAVSDKETAETERELDRRAQQQREIAETARQAKIPNHQRLAAVTLSIVKKGARNHYDFSGYAYQQRWQDIYDGSFDYFTGGYLTEAELNMEMLGTVLKEGPYRGLLNAGAKGAEIGFRRDFLNTAYYTYHNIYAQVCSDNREFRWVKSNPGVFSIITKRGGYEVSRTSKEGISHLVRQPFVDTYDSAYLAVGSYNNVSPEMPQELVNDFNRLLTAERCTSPSLRLFEVNLDLARNWLLPLQTLRSQDQESKDSQSGQTTQPAPSAKPKPATKAPGRRRSRP